MREILFRGKIVDVDGWFYGGFGTTTIHNKAVIIINEKHSYYGSFSIANGVCTVPVEPETVGQYTGLKDQHSIRIFEGDIVLANGHEPVLVDDFSNCRNFAHIDIRDRYDFIPGIYPFVCSWNDSFSQFHFTSKKYSIYCDVSQRAYKVIGNIHENPELLEKGEL